MSIAGINITCLQTWACLVNQNISLTVIMACHVSLNQGQLAG